MAKQFFFIFGCWTPEFVFFSFYTGKIVVFYREGNQFIIFFELQKPESWRLACQTIVGNKENSGKVICIVLYLVLASLNFCSETCWNLSLTTLVRWFWLSKLTKFFFFWVGCRPKAASVEKMIYIKCILYWFRLISFNQLTIPLKVISNKIWFFLLF